MSATTSYSPEFIKNLAIACHYAMKSKTDQREMPFMKSWQETSEEDKLLTKEAVVNILENKPAHVHFNLDDKNFLFSLVNFITGKLIIEKNKKPAFEEGLFTFGAAINALKQGSLVSRKGWNGKGMFIVKQIPGVIGVDIIPRMASLPDSVKAVFVERNQPISYESQMLIIKADGSADSWVPSSSDCFAEDWIIVK
ncbi:DUF2829 domain-containing protein [Flavobacterium sp. FlaQc-50]|uniref:DUF2829 domain-containing protein n=1 Tax=unclassified Flavobacterium TaxID=196869 RepID=UPI0037582CCA